MRTLLTMRMKTWKRGYVEGRDRTRQEEMQENDRASEKNVRAPKNMRIDKETKGFEGGHHPHDSRFFFNRIIHQFFLINT